MADPRQQEEGLVARSIAGFCGWNRGNGDDDASGRSQRASLSLAVKHSSIDCIRELLRAGESTEQVDEIGLTPLLAATRAGNTAAIAVLIEAVRGRCRLCLDVLSLGPVSTICIHR